MERRQFLAEKPQFGRAALAPWPIAGDALGHPAEQQ